MPDTNCFPDAKKMGDIPIWIKGYFEIDELNEDLSGIACGGMYTFVRLFNDCEDISENYNMMTDPPTDPEDQL